MTGPDIGVDLPGTPSRRADWLQADAADHPTELLASSLREGHADLPIRSGAWIDPADPTLEVATTLGQGSSFWVELPAVEGPVARAERQRELDPVAPPAPEPDEAMTVLYIEDNLSNLQLVERVLSRRPGVRLISAMRPQLGLELAAQHHPDLILLDLHLPDMPGQEVLRRLRAEPRTADVPVVILSADARPSLIEDLLAQGVRAFLTKPLDVKELLSTIATERHQPVL